MTPDEERKYQDFVAGELRSLKANLDLNTQATQEIMMIVGPAKGFFTVMGWIGRAIIWLAGVGGAGYGVYSAVRDFIIKRPPV